MRMPLIFSSSDFLIYCYKGFSEFERELILGCAKISSLYGDYYFEYLKAVQDPSITSRLASNPPSPESESDCYSHYTIVQHTEADGYSTISFAAFFADVLAPILAEMDSLVAKLHAVSDAASCSAEVKQEHNAYIEFFQHYRLCHSCDASASELEELWAELDRKWMNMKVCISYVRQSIDNMQFLQGDIQIVHDIETGYGDPLRMKATPDFSLRFLDGNNIFYLINEPFIPERIKLCRYIC